MRHQLHTSPCEAIKATALDNPAGCNHKDTFWGRLADTYRNDALYRAATDSQAEQGHNDACAIKATAFAAYPAPLAG